MLFETEKKANNFIKFNSEEIEEESGFKPERSYFCIACNGWHVTHHKEDLSFKSITEKFFGSSHDKEEQKTSEEEEEQKALLLAQKEEEERWIHLQKVQNLTMYLEKVEKNIKILGCLDYRYGLSNLGELTTLEGKCIDLLYSAFIALEKAKSTGIVFENSNQRIKKAEKKLFNFSEKKIIKNLK